MCPKGENNKVVHISDKTFAAAKEYCKKRNLTMKDWVSVLIESALSYRRNGRKQDQPPGSLP